jgi:hypothetical protein
VTAISDAIVQLRIHLDDQDAGAYRWTDAELTEHINHALADYNQEMPREQKTVLYTTPGSRDISISSLTDRVRILAIEYPTGNYPPIYVDFSVWSDTLTMLIDDPPATAVPTYVYWHIPHSLDVATTLSTQDKQTVLVGAAGYAASQLASYTAERVTLGGPSTDKDYAAMARRLLLDFRATIKRRSYKASLRSSRLYTPAEPAATQDTDPGP